jgi:putative flippase GtrA
VLPQLFVFIAGGCLSALIDVGLMQLLIAAGMAPLLATSAGFLAGLTVNFAFHARVTFNASAIPATFTRYLCVVALNYLLTIGMVALTLALFGSALAGKLVSLPVVAVNGYFFGKHWIFK